MKVLLHLGKTLLLLWVNLLGLCRRNVQRHDSKMYWTLCIIDGTQIALNEQKDSPIRSFEHKTQRKLDTLRMAVQKKQTDIWILINKI